MTAYIDILHDKKITKSGLNKWYVTKQGRIGWAVMHGAFRTKVLLQLGSSGPFRWFKYKNLRPAAAEEVEETIYLHSYWNRIQPKNKR